MALPFLLIWFGILFAAGGCWMVKLVTAAEDDKTCIAVELVDTFRPVLIWGGNATQTLGLVMFVLAALVFLAIILGGWR